MKKLIKTLIPLTTGLAVGVVVGRVNKKEINKLKNEIKTINKINNDQGTKLHDDFGKVLASNLDVSKLTATRSKFDELNSKVDSILFGDNSSLIISKDKVYIKGNKIKLDGTIEFE